MAVKKEVVLLKSHIKGNGGLEKYTSRIANAFLERGASVTLLTESGISPSESISLVACPPLSKLSFMRIEQYDSFVTRWLENHKADIIFGMDRNRIQTHLRAGNGVHAAYLQRRIQIEGRLKHLFRRLNPLHRKILDIEKEAFESPRLQKLFTNSEMVKKEVLEHYRIDSKKVQVVHNGVEWHEMQGAFDEWAKKKPFIAKQLGLDPNRFHLLFIGNGYLRKGLSQLLQALARLKNKEITLSVIGKERNETSYRTLAHQLKIEDQVHFFGPQKDLSLFYQLSDALAIPSFYDPFANVTVEALAMGLFTLSSKSNGGYEVLTDENGAIIDDPSDIEAIKDALEKAFKRPKTIESAASIRNFVRHLDFSNQLPLMIDASLC